MDKRKVTEFSDHYKRLSEWELADIHTNSASLTDEARAALDTVIADRGINLEKMREKETAEELEREVIEKIKTEKEEKRDARLFKIFLVIGLPIVILGAIFRPERSHETLISTLVQVAVLGIVAWIVLEIKRFRRKRKH